VEVEDVEEDLQSLRNEWSAEYLRTFVSPAQADTCPTCGQMIPESRIEDAREKAIKEFNLQKSARLEKITARGKDELAPKKTRLTAQLEQAKAEYDSVRNELLPAAVKAYEEAKATVEALRTSIPDMSADAEFIAASERKTEIRKQIDQLTSDQSERVKELKAEHDRIEKDVMTTMTQLLTREQHNKTLARIDELKTEERKLAAEL
jgi:hypothetical protein